MEYKEIKKIMEDMEKSSLAELSIEFPDGTKISLKNVNQENTNLVQTPITPNMPVSPNTAYADVPEKEISCKEEEGLKIVKSPMVGTFYAKPSPEANSFVELGSKVKIVEVGQEVKKGETLCIIEAMKLMNEIEAECDGEIVEILVKDGEMVDYGKPLFKMK